MAHVYSGREDPTWPLPAPKVERLLHIWDSLGPHLGDELRPNPLGYRGCSVRAPDETTWFAYRGIVTKKTAGLRESRTDRERAFEMETLRSAPAGLLPESLRNNP